MTSTKELSDKAVTVGIFTDIQFATKADKEVEYNVSCKMAHLLNNYAETLNSPSNKPSDEITTVNDVFRTIRELEKRDIIRCHYRKPR